MAKKKDDSVEMAAINFRCEAELKASLEDLAASCRQDVSTILIELVGELVAANKTRIEEFRKAAATPIIKPTFANPSKPAQVDESVTSDGLKGGEGNENS